MMIYLYPKSLFGYIIPIGFFGIVFDNANDILSLRDKYFIQSLMFIVF